MWEKWHHLPSWTPGRRRLVLMCACALSTLGFGAPNVRNPSEPRPVPATTSDTVARPVEIFRNSRSQLGAIRAVVQTREQFDHLWETMRRAKNQTPPEVDFNKDMVVVAGMGYEPQAGFGIDISSVEDSARVLEVTVEIRIATAICNKEGYAAIEHPAVMVRVPRSQSTVVFRDRLHRSC